MSFKEEFKIDTDSFPSFLGQYKDISNKSIKIEENSISFDNESFINANSEVKLLKDKLKSVEFEKKRLEIDIEAMTHRFNKEIQALESQIKDSKISDKKFQEDLYKIKEESIKYRTKSQETEEKALFFESQVDFLSKENKRLSEQYKIDKEN